MVNKILRLNEFFEKTIFFITAFTPLWIIIIIKYSFHDNNMLYNGLIFFVILPNWYMFHKLKQKRESTTDIEYVKVVQKQEITHDVIFYIFAYIPLLLINNFNDVEMLTFGILLFTIYILYINKNMLHINPIIILKYKTYRVIDDRDNTVILISKFNIKRNKDMPFKELTSGLKIIVDAYIKSNYD